jgi:hypothetical protein
MRVIYELPPVPSEARGMAGELIVGRTTFRLIVYEPGDPDPTAGGARAAVVQPLRRWRASVGAGAALRANPPTTFVGLGPVEIPARLLESVPDEALVEFRWQFERVP